MKKSAKQRTNKEQDDEPVMAKAASGHQNLLALLALLGLAALAGGCAGSAALPVTSLIGSPNASAVEIHNNTDVRLQEKNFIVIRTNVVGQSSGFSLLGVLTIVPAKFTKAMSRLYAQAEMQPGRPQTLVNLIMDKDATYFILFSLPRTSIRADVIEFIPATATDLQPRPPPGETRFKTE
jgi:hypothetical protein